MFYMVALCPSCQAMGAEVLRLRPVSITHPDHFVNVARRRAAEQPNAVFADQFENAANFRAHLKTGAVLRRLQLRPAPYLASCIRRATHASLLRPVLEGSAGLQGRRSGSRLAGRWMHL
jgi:hypothetical protein